MNWYCIRVPVRPSGHVIAQTIATLVRKLHMEAGLPPDVEVLHEISRDQEHRFYFSPECASSFSALLKLFQARACEKPDNLESFDDVLHAVPGIRSDLNNNARVAL